MKVALILPWYGVKPWYWTLFEKSAERINMDVIVIAEKGFSVKAKNFRVVEMSLDEVRKRASKALGTEVNLTRGYKLCDLRPMYGVVFADILEGYDYWAYGDCDVVYGRKFNEFLARAVSEDWEVATVQSKWLSGPFTMLRNTSKINTLYNRAKDWREVLKDLNNRIFDELGVDWFSLYCFGGVPIEDLQKRDWTFGGVVWQARDIRFLHEKVVIEVPLKHSSIHMRSDGCLMLDGVEIGMFHLIEVKRSPTFVGCLYSCDYSDDYILTRKGCLPSGNALLRTAVTLEHLIRGSVIFAWKLFLGRGDVRFHVLRFIRRKLGRDCWWRR